MMPEEVVVPEEELTCPATYDPGFFFLTEATLAKYPYPLEQDNGPLVFSDALDNRIEATFIQQPRLSSFSRYLNEVPCREDSTQLIQILGDYQTYESSLIFDSLKMEIVVRFNVNHDASRYSERIYNETASIFISSVEDDPYFLRPIPQLAYIVNENNWPLVTRPWDVPVTTIELNGVSYLNVFVNDIGNDKFLLYFNYAQGIVGFEDLRDGITYNLIEE